MWIYLKGKPFPVLLSSQLKSGQVGRFYSKYGINPAAVERLFWYLSKTTRHSRRGANPIALEK